jgi:hypothetical protein
MLSLVTLFTVQETAVKYVSSDTISRGKEEKRLQAVLDLERLTSPAEAEAILIWTLYRDQSAKIILC